MTARVQKCEIQDYTLNWLRGVSIAFIFQRSKRSSLAITRFFFILGAVRRLGFALIQRFFEAPDRLT